MDQILSLVPEFKRQVLRNLSEEEEQVDEPGIIGWKFRCEYFT